MNVKRSLLGAVAVAVTLVLSGAGDAQAQWFEPYHDHLRANTHDNDGFARGLLGLGAWSAAQPRVNFGQQPSRGAAIQHIRRQYPVHQVQTAPNPHVNYGRQPSRGAAIQHLRQLYPAQQIQLCPHGNPIGYGQGGHH